MNYRNADRKAWSARCKQEGAAARLRGAPVDRCPYALGGTLARAWREGYNAESFEPLRVPTVTPLQVGRAE